MDDHPNDEAMKRYQRDCSALQVSYAYVSFTYLCD